MILAFSIGFILYSVAVVASYSDAVKQSPFYFPLGMLVGLCTNLLWFWVAKQMTDKEEIIKYGFYWDSMIVGAYALIPVLFFAVRPNLYTSIGIALILFGITLTKVS